MSLTPAITCHAPWGSLIMAGLKSIETRTHDRFASLQGKHVAIHQGLALVPLPTMLRTVRHVGASRAAAWLVDHYDDAPRGYVLGTVFVPSARWLDGTIEDNVAACCMTDNLHGLELAEILALEDPVRVRGHQGIWLWDRGSDATG